MTAREVIRALHEEGWTWKSTKGSHRHFVHPEKPGKVTVPVHKGDIPKGTLGNIFKQAGWK